jgi:hypothetical protein
VLELLKNQQTNFSAQEYVNEKNIFYTKEYLINTEIRQPTVKTLFREFSTKHVSTDCFTAHLSRELAHKSAIPPSEQPVAKG